MGTYNVTSPTQFTQILTLPAMDRIQWSKVRKVVFPQYRETGEYSEDVSYIIGHTYSLRPIQRHLNHISRMLRSGCAMNRL